MSTGKLLNGIVLIFWIVIGSLGTFYKHISFGMGLGDLLGYAFMYIVILTHTLSTLYGVEKRKGNLWFWALASMFFMIAVIFILNATLLRGSEYRWNGRLFYP
ncbi:hypothetical protein FUAX_06950 [Fulvitalea axinellae]|uniref:Uncharacterized protein n=1 Tax=Fulvitalea axinellae TaxID=1182444 RepID=A0AAU9CEK3_9BACT|nr:hypothetical protein FUAX_06950 [Fulvitalea axinellae]